MVGVSKTLSRYSLFTALNNGNTASNGDDMPHNIQCLAVAAPRLRLLIHQMELSTHNLHAANCIDSANRGSRGPF